MKKTTILLIIILLVGAGIRLFDLDRGNAISDEVLYGFRAIGMLDFDFALYQPSPLEKFNAEIPTWVRLSFHDHPPLVFLVQHFFMGLFGVGLWGMRFSSALFGIASIWLVYEIVRRLYSEQAGLVSASLSAVTVLLVYAGRTGIQESQVIFFMLLTLWSFMRSEEDKRWLLLMGASLGLGILSKYTAGVIMLPILIYTLLYRRELFKEAYVYAAGAIALLLFSPVLYYNWQLFQSFGHFDFQLSFIFGQDVPYWQVTPGKEIGTLSDRFVGIFTNMWYYAGPLFSALSGVSVLVLIISAFKKKQKQDVFVILLVLTTTLLFLAIGPAPRFLTVLIPLLTIAIGVVVSKYILKFKNIIIGMVVGLLVLEGAYAINSYIVYSPIGTPVYAYSLIHNDQRDWGYNELDRYLEERLEGKYPELIVPYKYEFLEEIRQQAVDTAIARGDTPTRTLFIYNENMSGLGALWVLQRRALYEAWPIISAESYLQTLSEQDGNFYRRNGFEEFVFIQNTGDTLLTEGGVLTEYGDDLERLLTGDGIDAEEIRNVSGDVMFRVYVFE